MFRASNVIVDEAIDDGANLLKLAYGRVDTVVTDFASTLAYAKDNALAIRPLEPTYSVDALYTSFNSDRRDVMQRVDKALRSMCDDGWIEQRYVAQLGFGLDAVAGSGGCASGKGGKETG